MKHFTEGNQRELGYDENMFYSKHKEHERLYNIVIKAGEIIETLQTDYPEVWQEIKTKLKI